MLLEELSSARRGETDGGRRLSGCRRKGKFRKHRLAPFPGHLEHKVRPPGAESPQWQAAWEDSAFRGPGQRDADFHDGAQFRNLRMLKEL